PARRAALPKCTPPPPGEPVRRYGSTIGRLRARFAPRSPSSTTTAPGRPSATCTGECRDQPLQPPPRLQRQVVIGEGRRQLLRRTRDHLASEATDRRSD